MKLANIIYEKELVNHTKVDYVNYINTPTEYDKVDKSLPTLYVGWSFMKVCNPNNSIIQNADILKKKIIFNELYWECSFEESKPSHVKGVDKFVSLVPQFYFQPKYTYINLDPVFFQIVDIQGLMDVLPKEIDFLYNFKNEMIYLLYENKITGINLKMYDFFKFDVKEIIIKITERTKKCIDDLDGNTYLSYYKILPNFAHLKRYLIVILSN
ncbi:MAG: hypothetical protein WC428_00585 [Candidatus Paceibacterota bacterium]|jgi:hypothetical protein